MSQNSPLIRLERSADADAIANITSLIFGPGMKARAAYALREGVDHVRELSFVAEVAGEIVGTVRLTRIMIGEQAVLMLGPLGVLSVHKNNGIGKQLMEQAVSAARQKVENGGETAIMLVGDLAYYEPFGFKQVATGSIVLPRPVDASRILICELVETTTGGPTGKAARMHV